MAKQREHWTPTAGDAEAALVRRSRGGDLEAFGVLVRRHEAIVLALIGQILGAAASPAEVEETALAVFTSCWRDLRGLRDETRFPVWLSRRAVDAALRRPAPAGTGAVEAMPAMPGRARAVVLLHCAGGHSLDRVAQMLGLPPGDVWGGLYEGVRRLSPADTDATHTAGGRAGMYRTWLIPALEGALGQARRAELEARMAEDAPLAAEFAALRRSLPRLSAALQARTAHPSPEARASLWPHLHERLAGIRARARIPAAGLAAVGLLLALLLASSLADRQTQRVHLRNEAKWRRELRHAPLIVFHRDNAAGSATAARLRVYDRRVSVERRAAEDGRWPPAMSPESPIRRHLDFSGFSTLQ